MNIGIIGTGRIGSTLCVLLLQAGHQVWAANTRGRGSLRDLIEPLGNAAHAPTIDEASSVGDVVVIATSIAAYTGLPAPFTGCTRSTARTSSRSPRPTGKVVIDTGNYAPTRDGHIPELDTGATTSSEKLAAALPGAHVVKMFNTIYFEHLRDQPQPAGSRGRRALPMAGDDPDAKRVVATLSTRSASCWA